MSRQRRFRPAFHPLAPAVLLCLLGALLWASAGPAWSDDRELLRESSGDPYLFIILDTSGSMNEKPETSTDALAGMDDPASKAYQAKEALYSVMTEFSNISYGFATYNQDHLRVLRKHWIYQPTSAPSWSATLNYPQVGQGYAFGGGAGSDTQFSCSSPLALPATGSNLDALAGYPRTGTSGTRTYSVWLSQGGRTYLVTTSIAGGTQGDANLTVQLTRRRLATGSGKCGNNPPSNSVFDETLGPITLTYQLITDALLQNQVTDHTASNTCSGWEPNSDSANDPYTTSNPSTTINIKYPTSTNPSFPSDPHFNSGDVLPLDWSRDNKQEVLYRLAPNLRLGETVPDFRVARYFKDLPTGSISGTNAAFALELKDTNVRPLVADGSTPLGNTIQAFRTWYAGCAQGTCPKNTGWKDVAAQYDPNWACRKKYLLVLTDGDETCQGGNSACNGTAALRAQEGITTWVVAFGVQGGSNVLTCMASNGGSGSPVYPQDKTALINELRNIFGAIIEKNRTFASAAVPGVQAEVQDKIYLTNFTPLQNNSYWDGHVDAYLKPLPLTPDGLPDKTKNCSGSVVSGCHAWDAGAKLIDLAPTATDLSASTPNFHMGGNSNQRRVFYTQTPLTNAVPLSRKLLLPPGNSSDGPAANIVDRTDLYLGMGVTVPDFTNTSAVQAADTTVTNILKSTYKVKTDSVTDPDTGITSTINYVLGDIFHSNPILASTPNRAFYFAADLNGQGKTCANGDPGYRCFAAKHERRRKMLIVGSNDQQLHMFDAGIFRGNPDTGLFDNGTGYELMAYAPRPILPNLQVEMNDSTQHWGVDGTIQLDDVLIDPSHNGTPNASDREWRTVLVGGLREGGSGYFALDVTQPDTLDSNNVPQPSNTWVPSCWKGGSGCGPVPFGSVLWSFTDAADADNNGYGDLGQTWSTPNTGRIRVKTNDTPPVYMDKYVAVFGGGMDPSALNRQGNFLYMVDIETGKAIYKRALDGSAPSDPAAVDTDQDGYLDTVYIGTTAGSMYKADIRNAGTIVQDATTKLWTITDTAWDPFKIFDTLESDTGKRGQIFFPPSVIFVTQLGKYALAFGTGNRFDLWAKDGTPGRFYMILDDNFQKGMTAKDETQYTDITGTTAAPAGSDFLLRPSTGKQAGWYLRLDPDERMITKPFALSGITIFTSYDPTTVITGTTGGTGNGNGNGGNNSTPICARSGESNIFVIYTSTGDPVDPTVGRYNRKPDFVTNPFVESSATKNKPCDPTTDPTCASSVPVCADKANVTANLMKIFPANCQFANFTQNIETIQSDNGLVCIAPVPICVIRKNWKEN